MLLALALLLVATGLRAFAQDIPSLMLTTAGVGAGIAISGTLIGGFIKAEFPSSLALVMGVYATALAVAGSDDDASSEAEGINQLRTMLGRKCGNCGANAVIRKDGCDFCTACGEVGACG